MNNSYEQLWNLIRYLADSFRHTDDVLPRLGAIQERYDRTTHVRPDWPILEYARIVMGPDLAYVTNVDLRSASNEVFPTLAELQEKFGPYQTLARMPGSPISLSFAVDSTKDSHVFCRLIARLPLGATPGSQARPNQFDITVSRLV
jgi:hypothetical protein